MIESMYFLLKRVGYCFFFFVLVLFHSFSVCVACISLERILGFSAFFWGKISEVGVYHDFLPDLLWILSGWGDTAGFGDALVETFF